MKIQEDMSKYLKDLFFIFIIPILTFLSLDFREWYVFLRCQYLIQRYLLKENNPY